MSEETQAPKLFALPDVVLNEVLQVLSTKPYAEVDQLIAKVQKAQHVIVNPPKAEVEALPESTK
jgi:hypothetical protein